MEIAAQLEQNQAEFRAAAEGLTDAQAKTAPAPGSWSVLECVEHVVIAEGRFLGWLQNPLSDPAPPMDKEKEHTLSTRISGRATKAQAPQPVHPTGRFATLADALTAFEATRARSIAFVCAQGDWLYSLSAVHSFFGPVNGAEVALIMVAHATRHAAQIQEIRAAL